VNETQAGELNPVAIEAAIRSCAERISRGVLECNRRYEAYLTAQRDYDQALARAYLRADGPAHEKRHRAELATVVEREARDVCDAAYRFADRQARALTEELRAFQSIGASVRMMYNSAGRGEGA
jgi:hypothetical protein